MTLTPFLKITLGAALIVAFVVSVRIYPSLLPISDEEIDAQILGASVLMQAQYKEIRAHFPEETATIRAEAKRHERLRRRGRIVHIGNLVAFSRDAMAEKYRAIANAPEEYLDASLEAVLDSYAVLEGTDACGRFLMNGTIVLTVEERQPLWESQARDIPLHFETILAGIATPRAHGSATEQSWRFLYDLFLSQDGTQAQIETYANTFGNPPKRDQVEPVEVCAAFLGIGRALVGARFPGSAAHKAGLIVPSFGVSARP